MQYCRYHSYTWCILVETGWTTAYVTNGIACMIRK